jgi:integrase
MVIRIEQGKGRKDRYVMLSPELLAMLRGWWQASRPQGWLFPGRPPVNPLSPRRYPRRSLTRHMLRDWCHESIYLLHNEKAK